ncbi:MAG: hypothetical protein OEY49_16485 [Candidatus Heimdallarchaeota archaeon]|nr:hypothetical protein [Candidatus Heimdallarchaeota archaeon]
MEWEETELDKPIITNTSDIEFRLFYEKYTKTIKIEFKGVMGIGSEGNIDSDYMREVVNLTLNKFSIKKVILDYTNLTYEFGNSIIRVYSPLLAIPSAIIVSNKNKDGLTSLHHFYGLSKEKTITSIQGYFDTLEEGYKFLQTREIGTAYPMFSF